MNLKTAALLSLAITILVSVLKSNGDEDIVLGLLLPFSGERPIGRYIAGAMTIAVEVINNNDTLLPGRNLSFVWNDTECVGKVGLHETVDLFLTVRKLHGFIGGGCDEVCEPSGLLASAWNLPMVSWGCSSIHLSSKNTYNTLARTVGPYNKMAPLFSKVMQHYGWTRAYIFTSSESVWQTASFSVKLNLEANGIFVAGFVTFNPGSENIHGRETFTKLEIVKAAKDLSRIMLLFGYGADIRDLMLNAYDIGMTEGGYAFICVDILEDAHLSANTWMEGDGRDAEAIQSFNGILNVHIKTPEGDRYDAFAERVREQTGMEPFNRPMLKNEEVDVHAGTLYDAVVLYALGLHDVISEGGDEYDGAAIGVKMRNRKFVGIDNYVTIDDSGDRDPDYALQDFHDSRFEDFVHYDHITKELTFTPNFIPTWPGGETTPPKGEPDCGWDEEHCQSNTETTIVIISCCIFTLAVVCSSVVVFFYRRLRNEARLQAINLWRVNYYDIVFDTKKSSSFHSPNIGSQSFKDHLSIRSGTFSGGRQTASSNCTEIQRFCNYGLYKSIFVAIKQVNKKAITLERDLLIEITTARNMKHENINSFIGACIDQPNICILMEYSNKGSLQDVLENDDIKLDDNFKLSFAMDICKGLQYLSSTSLKSHGRLKSSNCVIDKRWVCKLTDYGFALFKQDQDETGDLDHDIYKASLWTAPEHLRCPPSSPYGSIEGDIYSYGIILQEIVIRGGPFCTQNLEAKEIVTAVKMGARPLFRPVVPRDACTPKMLDLMEMCWREKPDDRPSLSQIKSAVTKLSGGKTQNLVDNMIGMMEKYADHLEELVNERTTQLEEEKKKTDQLLHQMLPRTVAAQLKRGDVVTAEQYEQVTVYFSDIVGFTRLASESTPFQVVELLSDLYTLFDDTIDNYDVYKVETIGDAYMVASGVPERNGSRHAAEIGSMALDLLSSVKSFRMRHRPSEQLQLRSGMHTGPVVAGVVGQKMPRFCLFGDTVNTASRMESNGLALRVHTSSSTYAVLNKMGGFKLELRGEIKVKGKDPMITYWLTGKDKSDFDLPDLCLARSPIDDTFQIDELPGIVTSDSPNG